MKSKIIVEIETLDADKTKVLPEEGMCDDDFQGKESELMEFREDYAKDLHEATVKSIKKFFNDNSFINGLEERCLDSIAHEECLGVEDWESFDDYGIKITTKIVKKTSIPEKMTHPKLKEAIKRAIKHLNTPEGINEFQEKKERTLFIQELVEEVREDERKKVTQRFKKTIEALTNYEAEVNKK